MVCASPGRLLRADAYEVSVGGEGGMEDWHGEVESNPQSFTCWKPPLSVTQYPSTAGASARAAYVPGKDDTNLVHGGAPRRSVPDVVRLPGEQTVNPKIWPEGKYPGVDRQWKGGPQSALAIVFNEADEEYVLDEFGAPARGGVRKGTHGPVAVGKDSAYVRQFPLEVQTPLVRGLIV